MLAPVYIQQFIPPEVHVELNVLVQLTCNHQEYGLKISHGSGVIQVRFGQNYT